nr:MAG TPA: hypothetical protein [Caudoviricetes sp.]
MEMEIRQKAQTGIDRLDERHPTNAEHLCLWKSK